MSGKGSRQRPRQISEEEYRNNHDRIFGLNQEGTDPDPLYLRELHTGLFFEWYPTFSGSWELDKEHWRVMHPTKT